MVVSKINTKVNYVEKKSIDLEDVGHKSTLYVMEIYDLPIVIVLGKPKYTFSNKDVIFYPIYVVADNKIKSQIGVFETKSSKTIQLLDDDGDIDIDKLGEPLLYSFVNKKYIQKANSNPDKYIQAEEEFIQKTIAKKPDDYSTKKQRDDLEEGEIGEEEEETDENDALKLKVSKTKLSTEKEKVDSILEDGIFIINPRFSEPALLAEELESDADEIKSKYKETTRNTWIEKFMKNDQYSIEETASNGDCFFDTVRLAFEQIGKKTTIAKLRALVASQLTDEIFQENRHLYTEFQINIQNIKKELHDIKKTNDIYAKRMKKIEDKSEKENILKETEELKDQYKKKMKELKETEQLNDLYIGFMKDIDSIDKYRAYIQTSSFWADTWAISTLENLLKIKMIILSEDAYKKKAFDNVLNCGEINVELQKSKKVQFDPQFYIMTSYDGSHYRLINYKRKGILSFKEIPYDIKILTVNKCLEQNSGIFYMIQEFKNFKSKLGLDPDEGSPEHEDNLEENTSDLYDKTTTFTFHSKSLDSKPGKGAGEHIDKSRISTYATLSKIEDWRRKLDDFYTMPFTVDGHRWNTVEHYLQGSKFKKSYPDFYVQFSLDNTSELSTDVDLAKMVGDTSKTKYKNMRPKNVKIDVDYHLGRSDIERETALHAKFNQNEPLKQLLLATGDALLSQYLRRKPAEPDILLMKVRKQLSQPV